MTKHVVLFHSALGLRPAVRDWAARLAAAGYSVRTPDFYDGAAFDRMEDAEAKRDEIGIPALIAKAQESIANVPEVVVIGFSMGAAAAQFLAATAPNVRAAVLIHGALAPDQAGIESWPNNVPLAIHYAERDPLADPDGVHALTDLVRASGGPVDVYEYDVSSHLFTDSGLDDYNEEAAELVFERLLRFLPTT